MSEYQNIHEAIQFILRTLEQQDYASGTLKNYRNSFNVFEKYLADHAISHVTEQVCIDYILFKTGKEISGFTGDTKDRKLNRRMKPLHLLLLYLNTGQLINKPRQKNPEFTCPEGFHDEYHQFVEECDYRGYSNATKKNNVQKVQVFLKHMDSIGIHESEHITLMDIENFLDLYKENAIKYIGTILYVLRNYFSFLYERGFIADPVSTLLPKLRVPRNGSIPYSWEKADVLKLLEAVDRNDPTGKRDYAILLMTVHLGLRTSDIRNLKLTDLNWGRKTISIIMHKTKQPLELPLLDDIGWAVIDYLKNGRPKTTSPCLFIRHRPPFNAFGETGSFGKALHRYMIKAGINTKMKQPHGMHSLRSALAKNMLETEAPLPVISETLGHQNINTTAIYLKIDIKGLRKCALDPEEVFL